MKGVNKLMKNVYGFFTTDNYKIKQLAKKNNYHVVGRCRNFTWDAPDLSYSDMNASIVIPKCDAVLYEKGDKKFIVHKYKDTVLFSGEDFKRETITLNEFCDGHMSPKFMEIGDVEFQEITKKDCINRLYESMSRASFSGARVR